MNVLLNCGAPVKRNLEAVWPHLPNLAWLHSSAAGVEHILFPALVDGPVTLTNAKARVASFGVAMVHLSICMHPHQPSWQDETGVAISWGI